MTLWRWIISLLVWLSSDNHQLETEPGRAAAAVAAARASMLEDRGPQPAPPAPPAPTDCRCSSTCVKGVWRPDGRIEARCECQCARCVAERAKGCTSGTCPPR